MSTAASIAGGKLAAAADAEPEEKIHARSIMLASERHGVIAKMDLIEGEGTNLTPVDYRRGKRPQIARGVYDPERVQLCVQGLILGEHGYTCTEGIIYYTGSRERVSVPFDDDSSR